jgi:FAD/FMN-containing dehydrogenase
MKIESLVLPHDRVEPGPRRLNLAVDQQPAAVALPESAEEVAAVVRWARSRGLRVAPQGTGRNAAAMVAAHTVIVKTERMRRVEIDADKRIARVEAGVL